MAPGERTAGWCDCGSTHEGAPRTGAGPALRVVDRGGGDEAALERFRRLLAGLRAHLARRHGDVQVLQTHISAVLLAGDRAYKLKKPLDLGFLDFSTLARRRACCEAELRLNRHFAPQLYLDVLPVTGAPEAPELGGEGPPLDYVVCMRRFEDAAQLDRVLARGELGPGHLDRLAVTLSRLHEGAPPAPAAPDGDGAAGVLAAALENFDVLLGSPGPWQEAATGLRAWTQARGGDLQAWLRARRQRGRVRQCHGDLHLRNLVLLDEAIVPFDCIEFSEQLRHIDVMSDLAFLLMDLDLRQATAAASRLLNGYLSAGGDYDGLRGLRFYLVYRALVRAKVALIQADQGGTGAEAARECASALQYVQLAEAYTRPARAPLLITHGLSGSGKSLLAAALVEALGLVQLRSDVERKRLAGMAAEARSASAPGAGLYTAAHSRRTYEALATAARAALEGGFGVVVDATFLDAAERGRFRDLAEALGAPFLVLDLQAGAETLRERVRRRSARGTDASEADLQVLEQQLARASPLGVGERDHALEVDSGGALTPGALAARVRAHLAARGVGALPTPR